MKEYIMLQHTKSLNQNNVIKINHQENISNSIISYLREKLTTFMITHRVLVYLYNRGRFLYISLEHDGTPYIFPLKKI